MVRQGDVVLMTGLQRKEFLSSAQIAETVKEIFRLAAAERVRLVLAGGAAMQAYGSDRLTRDVDFVSLKLLRGLPPGEPLSFGGEQTVAPSGVPVDIIVRNDELEKLYDAAAVDPIKIDGVPTIRIEYLVIMKLASGRPKDDTDLAHLLFHRAALGLDREKLLKLTVKHLGIYAKQEMVSAMDLADWQMERAKAGKVAGIAARRQMGRKRPR
jgi:hypothetical protein